MRRLILPTDIVGSGEAGSHPDFREALIEASIVTNAALAAYSIEQELGSTALRAVYGVYVLETRQVWVPDPAGTGGPGLAAPPGDAEQFDEFTEAVVRSDRIRRLLGSRE